METDWLAMPDGYHRMFVEGDWITQPALYRVRADGDKEIRQLRLYAWQLRSTGKFQWTGIRIARSTRTDRRPKGAGTGICLTWRRRSRAAESWAAELLEPENAKES